MVRTYVGVSVLGLLGLVGSACAAAMSEKSAAPSSVKPVSDASTERAGGDFTEVVQFGARGTLCEAWGDYDNDGDPDLAVGRPGAGGPNNLNELYTNNGDGTFSQANQFSVAGTFALVWGDCDNDGDLDMAVGGNNSYLYRNEGGGVFSQIPLATARRTISLAWGDFDNDGDIDLAAGNGILGDPRQNDLYKNNGNCVLTREDQFGTRQSDSVAWGDFDNDGDLDLAVGNGGFGFLEQNYLYVNNGNGTFTERAEFGTVDTASVAWADFDNDGDLDLAVGNWENSDSYVYVNNGDGTFTGQLQFGTLDTNTVAWGDYNLDGWIDLAAGNGDFNVADQNYLYVNNGDGTFTEVAEFGLGSTDALAWADSDGDGDLDVACGNEHSPPQNYLYINNVGGDFLTLHLVGRFRQLGAGYSNRDGIGAKVSVYEQGFLGDPGHRLGFREVGATGGFSSQNVIDPTFGVPGQTAVDVRIVWPGSAGMRITQDLPGVATNQRITVAESTDLGPATVGNDVCVGGANAGLPCASHSACPGGACNVKNRFVSFSPGTVATTTAGTASAGIKVTLVALDPNSATGFNGQIRWVGPPTLNVDDGLAAPFNAAPLQCAYQGQDWSAITLLHVYGSAVVPNSSYDVRMCVNEPGPCTEPLRVMTSKFGDIIAPLVTSQPNFQDIVSIVDKFQNKPTGPSKTRTLLQGRTPNPGGNVTFLEVSAGVSAFQGKTFKQVAPLGPESCP